MILSTNSISYEALKENMKKIWIAIGTVLLMLIIYVAYLEEKGFQKFIIDKHCIVIGKQDATSSFGTGVTTNGDVASINTYTPEKTIYKCDGGFTRIR